MEFSEKIRYVREKLSISQEDLARALNVSYATVNRWENSKTKPIKMAQAAFDDFCAKHGFDFDAIDGKTNLNDKGGAYNGDGSVGKR